MARKFGMGFFGGFVGSPKEYPPPPPGVYPATADLFPVVANMRTKSIQKQIFEYDKKYRR